MVIRALKVLASLAGWVILAVACQVVFRLLERHAEWAFWMLMGAVLSGAVVYLWRRFDPAATSGEKP